MEENQIVKVIVEVLTEVQERSGREVTSMKSSICPIGDLPGFDSLNGVEATVELADRLGVELAGVNSFVNAEGTKALSISEIAANICASSSGKD